MANKDERSKAKDFVPTPAGVMGSVKRYGERPEWVSQKRRQADISVGDRPHALIVTWIHQGMDQLPVFTLRCPHEALGADRPCAIISCPRHDENADDT